MKHHDDHKGAKGWCNFVAVAHANKFINEIADQNGQMVPAVDAILEGEVGRIQPTGGGKSKGPAFILDCAKTLQWLEEEGATQTRNAPRPVAAAAGAESAAES